MISHGGRPVSANYHIILGRSYIKSFRITTWRIPRLPSPRGSCQRHLRTERNYRHNRRGFPLNTRVPRILDSYFYSSRDDVKARPYLLSSVSDIPIHRSHWLADKTRIASLRCTRSSRESKAKLSPPIPRLLMSPVRDKDR